jgi:hypothetical protein
MKPFLDQKYNLSLSRLRMNQTCTDLLLPFNPDNKSHVELFDQFGLYLFREQHYDFPLAWDGDDKDTQAYFLLLENAWTWTSVLPIGVALFTKQPYINVDPNQWFLMWVWIHPFERGRGVLSRVWPEFKKEFGDFEIQKPISFGMNAFLAKQEKIRPEESQSVSVSQPF